MAYANHPNNQDPLGRFQKMPDILDAIIKTLSPKDKMNLAQVSDVAWEHIDRAGYPAMARNFTAAREHLHPRGHLTVRLQFQPIEKIFSQLVQNLMPAIIEAEDFHPWPGWHYGPGPNVIVVFVKNATEGTLLANVRYL